ncbi:hypothetical protein HDU89_006770 [Geranomyces variabilis]|nr:hypothetical protein HDU89_006770 [Geranomyces variabilis]
MSKYAWRFDPTAKSIPRPTWARVSGSSSSSSSSAWQFLNHAAKLVRKQANNETLCALIAIPKDGNSISLDPAAVTVAAERIAALRVDKAEGKIEAATNKHKPDADDKD